MKKIIGSLLFLIGIEFASAQISKWASFAEETITNERKEINYIRFKESSRVNQDEVAAFINSVVFTNGINKVTLLNSDRDEADFIHFRFKVVQNGATVANKMIIAHCKEGKLISVNGDLTDITTATNGFGISENAALGFALKKVNAIKYKWQNAAEEEHMRQVLGQPDFSYFPKGEKTIIESAGEYRCAYQFNIYAEEPLYRANVFVDAQTGKILDEQNLICTSDVPGTAVTKYSGTQTITCDLTAGVYSLKEVSRGQGIRTYNLANTTNYINATNYTNTAANWTLSAFDQGALDAHWGAEKTYDYYWTQHNRNSINNAGFPLLSYVHYNTNYTNAFWDGQRMTYGDGNGGSMKIFTTLDICGHEISHGLTSNTGNLNYSYESGALNESFSDIFGTCIENYGRPTNWNWKVGEDMTNSGAGLRNMSNPNLFGDPDTYTGSNWYTGTADNGGVHTNSGVSNFWFYLLTQGGNGTNDLGNVYSVSGLGITTAARIAFRALTIYFVPTTNFANARALTIQAAKDLYGNCSNEMIQTMNAWYAVGVGAKYVAGQVGSNFTSTLTTYCTLPAQVSFNNTTPNGMTFAWDFGDGSPVSTATNPVHSYTANGIYNVKLKGVGCANAVDSIIKNAFITVNVPSVPAVTSVIGCQNSPAVLTATGSATVKWFDDAAGSNLLATGSVFTSPSLTAATSYYVSNAVPAVSLFGGILANTGGGYLTNNAQWLVFNVLQTSTLVSVDVYANVAGTRTIELRTAANAVLYSAAPALTVGLNNVVLNFPLTVSNNLRLGLSAGSQASLYRSNSGVVYPYNIGGCVSIVNSSAGAGAYYWYYNWEVLPEDCSSPLVLVNVPLNPLPSVSLSTPVTACADDAIVLNGQPSGGIYSGVGVNGSTFNASATGTGNYTVTYKVTDNIGCSNIASQAIQVDACTGLSSYAKGSSIEIYPNPAKDILSVRNLAAGHKIVLADACGRIIFESISTSGNENIRISEYKAGLYLLSVQDNSGRSLNTVKVIKE
jgi:Zn-dependent metalloprotease